MPIPCECGAIVSREMVRLLVYFLLVNCNSNNFSFVVKSASSPLAHQVGAISSPRGSLKRLAVFLLLPGWDASLLRTRTHLKISNDNLVTAIFLTR